LYVGMEGGGDGRGHAPPVKFFKKKKNYKIGKNLKI
jgi:hypothetical protein